MINEAMADGALTSDKRAGFYMMRGRKASPSSDDQDELVQEIMAMQRQQAEQSPQWMGQKRAPINGFVYMRGRKWDNGKPQDDTTTGDAPFSRVPALFT